MPAYMTDLHKYVRMRTESKAALSFAKSGRLRRDPILSDREWVASILHGVEGAGVEGAAASGQPAEAGAAVEGAAVEGAAASGQPAEAGAAVDGAAVDGAAVEGARGKRYTRMSTRATRGADK